jgi:CubicO group peptidase (beta-lactamase class C family)
MPKNEALKQTKRFREMRMMMKTKIFKTILGIFTLIVLVPVLMFVVKYASDIPIYKEGPATTLGEELGSIRPEIADQIQRLFDDSGIPSMAVAIVVGDELVWAKGLGEQTDLSTIYMTGSINKAYIATAFLSQVEDGLIGPQDDINDYLPFEFRNPSASDMPITLSMLLSHQSGLANYAAKYYDDDGPVLWWRFRNLSDFGALLYAIIPFRDTPTEAVEKAILNGDPKDVWSHYPNSGWSYSNDAYYRILGRVMGEIEGTTWQGVVRQRVIEPLGLENTSFEASDFPEGQLAIPYCRKNGEFIRYPITGYAASGAMRSNVLDLARFMTLHMNDGALDGVQIIPQESIAQMHTRKVVLSGTDWIDMMKYGWGWGWDLWTNNQMGHSGAVPGFMGQMVYVDAEQPYGVVVLINSGCSVVECDWDWLEDTFGAIRELLFEEGKIMAQNGGN